MKGRSVPQGPFGRNGISYGGNKGATHGALRLNPVLRRPRTARLVSTVRIRAAMNNIRNPRGGHRISSKGYCRPQTSSGQLMRRRPNTASPLSVGTSYTNLSTTERSVLPSLNFNTRERIKFNTAPVQRRPRPNCIVKQKINYEEHVKGNFWYVVSTVSQKTAVGQLNTFQFGHFVDKKTGKVYWKLPTNKKTIETPESDSENDDDSDKPSMSAVLPTVFSFENFIPDRKSARKKKARNLKATWK